MYSIFLLLVWIIVVGLLLYLVNSVVPLPPPFKMVINVVVILLFCFWLLYDAGIFSGRGRFRASSFPSSASDLVHPVSSARLSVPVSNAHA